MRMIPRARAFFSLCLILLIVQSASCVRQSRNPPQRITRCETPECHQLGEEFRSNMGRGALPCRDFYSFTCGNWRNNNPGPRYASEWSLIEVLTSKYISIIRDVLETNDFPSRMNSMRQLAKDVYKTCVKIPELPLMEADDIRQKIINAGRYLQAPLWEIHNNYLNLTGESAFFSAKILSNRPSDLIPVLMLMEPLSAYGSIFHDDWELDEEEAYLSFLFQIMKSLNLEDSEMKIKRRIKEVFEFRKNLDYIIDENSPMQSNRFDPLTEQELHEWFLDNIEYSTNTQRVLWPQVVEILLQYLNPKIRHTKRVVAIRQTQYFVDLMELLGYASEEVLVSHMEIYFVERHLKLNENMVVSLKATSVQPHKILNYIRERYYPRWHFCIKNHNMHNTLDRLLYDKWFPKEYEGIIEEMIANIRKAMEKQMAKSTWLTRSVRQSTMSRLNNLDEWLGFPKWFRIRAIPGERMDKKEILTANAVFNIAKNLLDLHAPILLLPLFHSNIPAVFNYAGLGATIGHELYHVIDNCGSYINGKKTVTWWPHRIRQQCLNKMKPFVEAYNFITERDFWDRYGLELYPNTTISLSENFPDVMGLEAAYNAYHELLSKDKSVCQSLPGLESYTCDQMFYIAFGNSFCGYYTRDTALDKLVTGVHSIDSVRVNGAVAQMVSFGEAFNCPLNTPLNPRDKLDLWK